MRPINLPCIKLNLVFNFQKILLISAYSLLSIVYAVVPSTRVSWVVGVDEIAALVNYISKAIPGSFSVVFDKHPLYSFDYDFLLSYSSGFQRRLKRIIYGPLLLAWLLHKSDGFLYIWSSRFLISSIDEGAYEYNFIKDKGKKIVLFFVGSDIRSPMLTRALARQYSVEVEADYYSMVKPQALHPQYELMIEKRASVAERFADLVITAKNDQASYFRKPTTPFIYFYPDANSNVNFCKYSLGYKVKIVHCPSSPVTKGTPLVRAAITRLKRENYDFDYVELVGVSNTVVLSELYDAHIVLNEFYAWVPGVFGVEAMANFCALMTAADENLETDLPQGSNLAWLSTKSYEVYDNLKFLLDNPKEQKAYAIRGYRWFEQFAAQSASGPRLSCILDSVLTS